jgi:hypothetical protein
MDALVKRIVRTASSARPAMEFDGANSYGDGFAGQLQR